MTMEKAKLYSPNQIAGGSFLGGPFMAVFTLWWNFRTLGNRTGTAQTLIWGAAFIVAVLAILPFLPEKFPNYVLPAVYMVAARQIADKYQLSKDAIAKSNQFTFVSNWAVVGIAIGLLLAFFAVAVVEFIGLAQLGIITF
jgi:4-amino-4-deoxy-L-arabinose transferase-like glycosyltransferase